METDFGTVSNGITENSKDCCKNKIMVRITLNI